MSYTFPLTKEMVAARSTLRISRVAAEKICKAINRKKFADAKKLLEDVAAEKRSIDHKYYTKATKQILGLARTLEANASAKGAEAEGMMLYACAHMGPTLLRGRKKRGFGTRLKVANVQMVLKPQKEKKE